MNFFYNNKLLNNLNINVVLLLNFFLLTLPISFILGNAIVNINCFIIILLFFYIYFSNKSLNSDYKVLIFPSRDSFERSKQRLFLQKR